MAQKQEAGIGNGLNKLGSVTTKMGIFFGGLFTLIFFLITLYFAKKIRTSPYKKIKAVIESADCTESTQNVCETKNKTKTCRDELVYRCNLQLKYTVNGKEYNKPLTVTQKSKLTKGQKYNIEYNKNNPGNIRTPQDLKPVLYIFIGLTIFSLIMTLLKYFLSKSRLGRQVNGAMFIKNLIN